MRFVKQIVPPFEFFFNVVAGLHQRFAKGCPPGDCPASPGVPPIARITPITDLAGSDRHRSERMKCHIYVTYGTINKVGSPVCSDGAFSTTRGQNTACRVKNSEIRHPSASGLPR
jgi:hypothetical protein